MALGRCSTSRSCFVDLDRHCAIRLDESCKPKIDFNAWRLLRSMTVSEYKIFGTWEGSTLERNNSSLWWSSSFSLRAESCSDILQADSFRPVARARERIQFDTRTCSCQRYTVARVEITQERVEALVAFSALGMCGVRKSSVRTQKTGSLPFEHVAGP